MTVEEAEDAPRTGRIFVDASALPDEDARAYVVGEATTRGKEKLAAEGVEHTDAAAGPELRVTISPDGTGYAIQYEIVYEGKAIHEGSSDCQRCTEGELLERVESIAVEQAPNMVEPAPEPETPPDEVKQGGNGDQGGDGGGGGDQTGETDEPDGMGGMGKAGIALLVSGGVGAGVGVGLLIRKPRTFPSGHVNASQLETTRPTGGILLGSGVALAVTGAVLLALDVKRRKRGQPKETSLRPWLGPGGTGVVISGRF